MSAHKTSEEQRREELKRLLGSDCWKYLSMPTKQNVLIKLDEYKWGYLQQNNN